MEDLRTNFKRICLVVFFALASVPAFGQSSPNFTYGQTPTSGQWKSYFAAKQDVLGYRPLNRASDTMTGPFYVAPSTAFKAGVNFAVGVDVANPQNGDAWISPSGFYIRAANTTYNLSGAPITCAQLPALVGDITTTAGSCSTALSAGAAARNLGAAIGTTGATIGLNNGSNTYSGTNSHTGNETFSNTVIVPTRTTGDASFAAASTQFVANTVASYAGLGANTFTGKQTLPAGSTSAAPLNIPQGAAPTTRANGDFWTTSLGLYVQINGTTVGPLAAATGATSPPQFTEYLSGSGTYSTPTGATRLEIEGIGGGKGGNALSASGNGGDTTFGPITAPGGGSGTTQAQGAAIGSFFASGPGATGTLAVSTGVGAGGIGGGSIYGGNGTNGIGSNGYAGSPNTGAGGGGAGTTATSGSYGGSGGASGTSFKMIITSPAVSYPYAVGAGGSGAGGGAPYYGGGAGAAGRIRIVAYFN